MPQLLVVDSDLRTLKNSAVDKKAIGKRIESLRREKFGTQGKLAAKAKVAPNTVRGLEKGKLDTRGPQMQRILRALGTTFEELVRGDEVRPTDPLLAGLNREDLQIARFYHDATTAMRQCAASLLRDGEGDEVSGFIARVLRLNPDDFKAIDVLLAQLEETRRLPPASTSDAAQKKQ